MNLFGPSRYASLSGKYYAFVIVDDFSGYTCILFLRNKDDTFDAFKIFCKKVKNEKKSMLFITFKVIMVRNLKIMILKIFTITLALSINSHHQRLHNKME